LGHRSFSRSQPGLLATQGWIRITLRAQYRTSGLEATGTYLLTTFMSGISGEIGSKDWEC